MKKGCILSLIMLSIFLFLFLQGCISSQKTTAQDLLNSDNESAQYDSDEIEKLLGITPEESAAAAAKEASAAPTFDTEQSSVATAFDTKQSSMATTAPAKQSSQNEISNPSGTLATKIAKLRTMVESMIKDNKRKDTEISELKTQLNFNDSATNFATSDENNSKQSQSLAGISSILGSTRSTNQYATNNYKAEYDKGLSYFHQKRYVDAISVFEHLLTIDKQNDYSDNAQYWKGESYFALRNYQKAILDFEKVFAFRNSNKNDYAQYKIAQCYYYLGNKLRANQEFQNFLDNYPNSELVSYAHRYLRRLQSTS